MSETSHTAPNPKAARVVGVIGIIAATGVGKLTVPAGKYISEKVAPPGSIITLLDSNNSMCFLDLRTIQ